MRGKKAEGDTYVTTSKVHYFIVVLFVIIITLTIYLFFGFRYINASAPVPVGLPENIMMARVTNVCMSWENEGRVYQNVIDYTKVTANSLRSCFGTETPVEIRVISDDDSFPTKIAVSGPGVGPKPYSKLALVRYGEKTYPATVVMRK